MTVTVRIPCGIGHTFKRPYQRTPPPTSATRVPRPLGLRGRCLPSAIGEHVIADVLIVRTECGHAATPTKNQGEANRKCLEKHMSWRAGEDESENSGRWILKKKYNIIHIISQNSRLRGWLRTWHNATSEAATSASRPPTSFCSHRPTLQSGPFHGVRIYRGRTVGKSSSPEQGPLSAQSRDYSGLMTTGGRSEQTDQSGV